ncbi:hypothetical protein [Amycolatopsis sp. NBC_00438]|uniref:hypothetical protein n=1 Tax=Amycolatopsis sp. NBC_00438 TaxID=2903558 RepID=UPI002E20BBF5
MTNEHEDHGRVPVPVPDENETGERTLDRGLAPPSVPPEVTSTHPLDRGLAPPEDEEAGREDA